jgi:tRNA (uracil-5-)-methyltransferase TRM9
MIVDTNKIFFNLYSKTREYAKRYPAPNQYSYNIIRKIVKENDLICDIGCGTGRYIIPLVTENHKTMIGIDISEEMINELREHLKAEHLNTAKVDLICNDIGNIKLKDDSVDVVLGMFGTISHFNPPEKRTRILKKIYNSLKPGGYFIGSVPNRYRRFYRSQLTRLFEMIHQRKKLDLREIIYYRQIDGMKHGNYYYLYTPKQIRNDLAGVGFENIRLYVESVLSEHLDIKYNLHKLRLRPLLLCSQMLFVGRRPYITS